MYLSNIDQREIEPTSDKIDDDSVQALTPSTPIKSPQISNQPETPLLQNVKQIPEPSAQQEALTFEQFKLVT